MEITEITTDPKVDAFVTEDKNLADAIRDGYEQGAFDKTFGNFSKEEIRQQLDKYESTTFRTQQVEAFVDILNREMAKREGHLNAIVAPAEC